MAGAHGVDVGLLHEGDVLQHGLHIDGAATGGMGVLCVDALEVDLLAIDVDAVVVVGDLHIAEAILGGERLFLRPLGIGLCHLDGVEVGLLSVPKLEVGEALECYILCEFLLALLEGEMGVLLAYLLALGADEAHAHILIGGLSVAVVHGEGHGHRARLVAVGGVEHRGDVVVADVGLRCGEEVHVAMDAAHVPHVLTLEV